MLVVAMSSSAQGFNTPTADSWSDGGASSNQQYLQNANNELFMPVSIRRIGVSENLAYTSPTPTGSGPYPDTNAILIPIGIEVPTITSQSFTWV
jgi:hypothetical protein